jgi:hypothetical protein
MKKIPILIAIDSEPNHRLVDPKVRKDWTGFEKTYEFFTEFRPRFEAAIDTPVHFSWFLRMDPQIAHVYGSSDWVIKRYSEIIRLLEIAGDDLGLHTHPWRWDEPSNNWIADFGSQEWINHCVEMSFRTFQETFGRGCQSFSFGDHWMNEETSHLLEKLGVCFDFTPQPGLTRVDLEDPHTGSFPDYAHLPRHAYRPSRNNFITPASRDPRGLWVIPLSTGSTDWAVTSLDPSAEELNVPDDPRSSPLYEGYHDATDRNWVVGWAWNMNRPEKALNVEICDGDAVIETITANSFRHDLLKAGKGNGKHAFRYLLPDTLRDGKEHLITVKVANSSFSLYSSPQSINTCYSDFGKIDMAMFLNHEPFLFSKVMDRLLTESENPYLAFIARSDIGIRPDEKFNVTQNLEHILNHPLIDRFVFETSPEFIKRISQETAILD